MGIFRKMFKIITPALALTAMVSTAVASENWTQNLPAALAQAVKEKKLVLVDFNGSDWCGPCIQLKSKVLDQDEFLTYAKKKFILVDIDLPRNKKIAPKLLKANQALTKQYAVTGFPSIFVMNTDGFVVGGFIGGNDSIPIVQETLDKAILNAVKIQVALEQAATLAGEDRAKALYAIYKMVPSRLQSSNVKMMSEIEALDMEDSLGIKKSAAAKAIHDLEYKRIMSSLDALAKDPHVMLEYINKELSNEKLGAVLRTRLNSIKVNLLMFTAESLEDVAGAKDFAISFAKTRPNSGMLITQLEKIFLEPRKLLEEMKEARAKYETNK